MSILRHGRPSPRRRLLGGGLVLAAALLSVHGFIYAQMPFRIYENFERDAEHVELPADYMERAELVVGRLMYPSSSFGRGDGDGGSWTVDYPIGDRTLARMLRRFTRADTRSVEQPVSLDHGDDIFYWPYLSVGLAGNWNLSQAQADKLREYLLRGGFLFCDSFFGSEDWAGFVYGMDKVFPDRQIVDLTDDHQVFHSVYDLPNMTRVQIPHAQSLLRGGGGYLSDGAIPRWRGILDDHGRLMVLIALNNDVSDSWQWADDPRYPADKANLGIRIGINNVIYAMTH